ncbi:winged helix-turn-helix transcriptional regulator [Gardnerella sp. DNF01141]|uniref:winged helix-turn-helix transcriptional regulator n=1 Tax=Gardnerella sp. DNF01141 TaxID=2749057 RepID=UPI003BA8A863
MTDITLMTSCASPATVLPSLALLSHRVRVLSLDSASLSKLPAQTVLLIDAREDLALVKSLCALLRAENITVPVVLVLTEGGFTVVNSSWNINDVVLTSASPAEVEGRLRLASQRIASNGPFVQSQDSKINDSAVDDGTMRSGDLVVDMRSYTVSLHGRPVDLAYKEFELLKYFVQNPRRVFTRAHLLQEVWGYDYYGGTRTVDVHIRRLRAKLGVEYEHLIGTVRNVGYRFDPSEAEENSDVNEDAPNDSNGELTSDSSASDSVSKNLQDTVSNADVSSTNL